jgi:cell shape-determining protein MreC
MRLENRRFQGFMEKLQNDNHLSENITSKFELANKNLAQELTRQFRSENETLKEELSLKYKQRSTM